MPTVHPPAKVLVSGASGYIAAWIVRTLLERGFAVRGTVRSNDKQRHLKEIFVAHGERLELVIVPDIANEGAFDEAVKGVDAILHTASPCHLHADDPDELIVPAVKGTVGILESALKYGSAVQRIIVTSSVAAVVSVSEINKPKVYTQADFNDASIEVVKREGKNASGSNKYRASKTLAEKAAWQFYKEHEAHVNWDLSVMNPPIVLGPFIHEVGNVSALNESLAFWYKFVVARKEKASTVIDSDWVDVRDLAIGHVKALEAPDAGGHRFLVTSGPFAWQHWVDIADGKHPEPGTAKVKFDDSIARGILGMKYKSMEETARDSLDQFREKGWKD